MFNKKKADGTVKPKLDIPNTVIGKGITIEAARLSGKESVRIDGTFFGDVNLEGSLILGEGGVIEGRTHANYAVIAGSVRGDISCETVLHVAPTARIDGDIKTNSIIVDEGGQINGRNQVGEAGVFEPVVPQTLLPSETEKLLESYGTDRSYLNRSIEIEIIDARETND